jgi:acyl-CoA thioester hydrolase
MATYRLERRLSHADVDFLGELKVPALLGLLEQAAVEASSAAGFDAARYTREGRIWIIRRTELERYLPVGGTDTVEVETSVSDFRRARSLRRYTVRRGTTVVAQATTDWVYCDLGSGRPVRVPEDLQRAFLGGHPGPPLPRPERLRLDGEGEPVALAVTVWPSHLDHVAHVNNAVYVSFLEDGAFATFATHGWSLSRMLAAGGALRIASLDVEYLSDAGAGDRLVVESRLGAGEPGATIGVPPLAVPHAVPHAVPRTATLQQAITRSGGPELLRARTRWVWRRRPAVVGGVPE